jgi:hypothetical protein
VQPVLSVLWKVDGHRFCVDDPSQDGLDGVPRSVALAKLLHGDGLGAVRVIVIVEWP